MGLPRLLPSVEDFDLGSWHHSIHADRIWPNLSQTTKVPRLELPCAYLARRDLPALIECLRRNNSHPQLAHFHVRMLVHMGKLDAQQASEAIQLFNDVEEACAAREPAPVSFHDGGTRAALEKIKEFRTAEEQMD